MATRQDWESLFRDADSDSDGLVTLAEMMAALKRCGYPGDENMIKGYFHDMDTSGDRKVSREEFMKAMSNAPVEFHVAAIIRTVFSHFDKSGDGEITPDEMRQALAEVGTKIPDDTLQRLFTRLDTDRSGSINIQEFLNAIEGGDL